MLLIRTIGVPPMASRMLLKTFFWLTVLPLSLVEAIHQQRGAFRLAGQRRQIRGLRRGVIVASHQADAVDDVFHLPGDERDVRGAGPVGAHRGDRPRSEIAAGAIVFGKDARVAWSRRQRGVAVLEG